MAKVRGPDGMPVEVSSRRGGKAPELGKKPRAASGGEDPKEAWLRITPEIGEAPTEPESPRKPAHGQDWRAKALGLRDDGEVETAPPRLAAEDEDPQGGSGRRRRDDTEVATVFGGAAASLEHQPSAVEAEERRDGAPRPAARRGSGQKGPRPADFVTGWLAVVDGPGKGASFQLGFGPHRIGRGQEMRVRLDLGDTEVSRDSHAVITYEPRSNQFFLQPVNNLVYRSVAGGLEPLLTPEPLSMFDEVVLGRTRLRFVSLCGESFVWR